MSEILKQIRVLIIRAQSYFFYSTDFIFTFSRKIISDICWSVQTCFVVRDEDVMLWNLAIKAAHEKAQQADAGDIY